MMLLISPASTVAASMATAVGVFGQEIWWEPSLLIAIMLLGHWIEMRAIGRAQGVLAASAHAAPTSREPMSSRV
jgi:Cu2+-exporting ATPase